jgi:lipopolysaccharide biosynthesis glycosyltransferase
VSAPPLELACAARRDYVPHCAAMIDSVLERAGGPVRVHFLHGPDLRSSQGRKLAEMVRAAGSEISLIEVLPERVRGLRTIDWLPGSHWYRIFLPELLPGAERVLYLDADTIVVDSLGPLWETDLAGNLVGAVTNVWQHDHLDHPARLELADPGAYFNTGVLLIDLDAFRREGVTEELVAAAREHHEKIGFPEQDAMNIVVGGRRLGLHPRWNLMNSILRFESAVGVFGEQAVREARERPAIRHFEGPGDNKPWHLLCEREGRELYREHRRRTPWPRVRPEGLTPRNLARRARRGAPPHGTTQPR